MTPRDFDAPNTMSDFAPEAAQSLFDSDITLLIIGAACLAALIYGAVLMYLKGKAHVRLALSQAYSTACADLIAQDTTDALNCLADPAQMRTRAVRLSAGYSKLFDRSQALERELGGVISAIKDANEGLKKVEQPAEHGMMSSGAIAGTVINIAVNNVGNVIDSATGTPQSPMAQASTNAPSAPVAPIKPEHKIRLCLQQISDDWSNRIKPISALRAAQKQLMDTHELSEEVRKHLQNMLP